MDIFTTLNLRMYFNFGQVPYYQKTRCQVTGGVITIGDIPPPVEIYPSVGSGHHRTKRKKARHKQRAQNALSVFNNPESWGVRKDESGRLDSNQRQSAEPVVSKFERIFG
jgi:hypothetical protein